MEINDFIGQIAIIKEKELEKRVWEIWLAKYPHMTPEDYVSYEEMLLAIRQQEVKQVDNAEIPVNGCYVDQIFF